MVLSENQINAIKRDDHQFLLGMKTGIDRRAAHDLAIECLALRVLAHDKNIEPSLADYRRLHQWKEIRILWEAIIRHGNPQHVLRDSFENLTVEEIQYLGTRGMINPWKHPTFGRDRRSYYLPLVMGIRVMVPGESFDETMKASLHNLSIRPFPLWEDESFTETDCFYLVMYDNFKERAFRELLDLEDCLDVVGSVMFRSIEEILPRFHQLHPWLLHLMVHNKIDRDRVLLVLILESETVFLQKLYRQGISLSAGMKERISIL